jgi:hypothetical protein
MTIKKQADGTCVLTNAFDSKAITLYRKYTYSSSYNTHGWAQQTCNA